MNEQEFRWSPRVSQRLIRQLYETNARGIFDDELVNEVGIALYARCESSLRLADAYINGKVECPRCHLIVSMPVEGRHKANVVIKCEACSWETTWSAFKRTFHREKVLHPGNAIVAFRTFVNAYGRASTAKQRTIEIDRLLQEFHRGESRPIASDVIEGSQDQVIAFLDELAGYRPAEQREAWSQRLQSSGYVRRRAGKK